MYTHTHDYERDAIVVFGMRGEGEEEGDGEAWTK